MSDYWFRPKRVGWGVSPANWKGWTALAALVVWVIVLHQLFYGDNTTTFWIGLVLSVVAFLAVTWFKTGHPGDGDAPSTDEN